MKKTTILLGMLSLGFAYAQQGGDPTGKVGVNTQTPTETLEVAGTVKVTELPTQGTNKIYNGQTTKTGTFTPTKTVVADNNGVLGTVGFVIPEGTTTNTSLKWDDGAKKWVAVEPTATATGPDQNDEAWKKQQTADRVTNNDDTTNIYRSTNVGIGDFSNSSIEAPLHIRKTNAQANITFGIFQVTDRDHTDNGLASMFQFLARGGRNSRFGMIGDTYDSDKMFEFRGEHGYTTRLSSFEANHQNYNRASIDLKGGGFGNAAGNGDIVKIKFNTGQFKNNPRAYGITSISKHGNWYFGADAGKENTPADQKVVIRGALRFDGPAFPGLTDNASVSNALAGTMFFSNGHFFGVIPNGTNAFKWKQLDNIDYEGGNGISVAGNTISLPTGTNGQVLTWDGNAWVSRAIPTSQDTNTNIYTDNGEIPVGTNRMVTLANPATGGRNGAKLNFTLSDGTDKAFNIIQADGTKGFSLSTKGANQTQNLINFFNNADTRQAYLGFTTDNAFRIKNEKNGGNIVLENKTEVIGNDGSLSLKATSDNAPIYIAIHRKQDGSDARNAYLGYGSVGANSKDFVIKNEIASSKIVLGNEVKIETINPYEGATHVLVDNNGVVSKKAISSLTTSAAPTEPWFVMGGNNQATNSNNNGSSNIYFNGGVGIGNFGANNGTITTLGTMDTAAKQNVKLAVKGAVLAGSFKGAHGATIFPDYVFQKYYTGTSSIKADYTFKSLSQVEDFVKSNGHLPGYKSAADIKAQGYIDVMETQISNVEKIEELYLHTIEQEKALKEKDAKIKSLEERLERLEKLIK